MDLVGGKQKRTGGSRHGLLWSTIHKDA